VHGVKHAVDVLGVERLVEEAVGARFARFPLLVGIALRGDHDDLQAGLDRAQLTQRRQPVDLRHVAVEQDGVEGLLAAMLERGRGVARLHGLAAEHALLHDFQSDAARRAGIIDDQHFHRRGDARVIVEDRQHVVDREWLEQEFIRIQLLGELEDLRRGRPRNQRDEGADALPAGHPDRFHTGELGHVNVDEGDVDVAAIEQRQAVTSVVGGAQAQRQLRLPQGLAEQVTDQVLIVRDQHMKCATHR